VVAVSARHGAFNPSSRPSVHPFGAFCTRRTTSPRLAVCDGGPSSGVLTSDDGNSSRCPPPVVLLSQKMGRTRRRAPARGSEGRMRLPVSLLALAGHISAQRLYRLNRDADDTREHADKKDRAGPNTALGPHPAPTPLAAQRTSRLR
jgi:hypothetical protein